METDADADVADGEKKKISLKANTGSSFHSASGIIFVNNKKSKNRIIRINTGILSNMKQKIKEFYH